MLWKFSAWIVTFTKFCYPKVNEIGICKASPHFIKNVSLREGDEMFLWVVFYSLCIITSSYNIYNLIKQYIHVTFYANIIPSIKCSHRIYFSLSITTTQILSIRFLISVYEPLRKWTALIFCLCNGRQFVHEYMPHYVVFDELSCCGK